MTASVLHRSEWNCSNRNAGRGRPHTEAETRTEPSEMDALRNLGCDFGTIIGAEYTEVNNYSNWNWKKVRHTSARLWFLFRLPNAGASSSRPRATACALMWY